MPRINRATWTGLLASLILIGILTVPAALAAETTSSSVTVSSGTGSPTAGMVQGADVTAQISLGSSLTGFARSARQRGFEVHFGEFGDGPTRLVAGNSWISFHPVGAAASRGDFRGNRARFPGVWPGADAVYSVEPEQLKEEIILSSPVAGNVFTFRVETKDAYPDLQDDGSIAFLNSAGQEVFEIPTPFAFDSAAGGVELGRVRANLRGDDQGLLLDIVVDADWLQDSSRSFPVTVDPTVSVSGSGSTGKTVYFNIPAPQTFTWNCSVSGRTRITDVGDDYYTGYFAIYDPSGVSRAFVAKTGSGTVMSSGAIVAGLTQIGNWRMKAWGTGNYGAGGSGTVYFRSSVPRGTPSTASVSGSGPTGRTTKFRVNTPQDILWTCNLHGYTDSSGEINQDYGGYFAVYDPSGTRVAYRYKIGEGTAAYTAFVTASPTQLGDWSIMAWGNGTAGGSGAAYYYLNEAPSATPESPAGGVELTTLQPTLTWMYQDPESMAQAKAYIQVSNEPTFSVKLKDVELVSPSHSWQLDTNLLDHTTYYWRVRVIDADGIAQPEWSPIASFRTLADNTEQFSYTYGPTGDRLTQTKLGVDYAYNYSLDGLLQSVTHGSTTEDYFYDRSGNLTQHRVTTDGALSGTWDFDYDVLNRLTTVHHTPVGGSKNWVAKYVYDTEGLRVRTVHSSTSTTPAKTTVYIYDGLNVVYEEVFDGVADPTASLEGLTPNLRVSYVYADGQRIAKVETDSLETTCQYFYLNDHLGSTRAVTDSSGATVASMSYEPFGALKSSTGDTSNEAYRYTGKPYDDPVGLYYYGARFYDPSIGRFITQDPAQDGLNWYVYCNNNPTAFVDPDGNKAMYVVNDATRAFGFGHLMLAYEFDNGKWATRSYQAEDGSMRGLGKVYRSDGALIPGDKTGLQLATELVELGAPRGADRSSGLLNGMLQGLGLLKYGGAIEGAKDLTIVRFPATDRRITASIGVFDAHDGQSIYDVTSHSCDHVSMEALQAGGVSLRLDSLTHIPNMSIRFLDLFDGGELVFDGANELDYDRGSQW